MADLASIEATSLRITISHRGNLNENCLLSQTYLKLPYSLLFAAVLQLFWAARVCSNHSPSSGIYVG